VFEPRFQLGRISSVLRFFSKELLNFGFLVCRYLLQRLFTTDVQVTLCNDRVPTAPSPSGGPDVQSSACAVVGLPPKIVPLWIYYYSKVLFHIRCLRWFVPSLVAVVHANCCGLSCRYRSVLVIVQILCTLFGAHGTLNSYLGATGKFFSFSHVTCLCSQRFVGFQAVSVITDAVCFDSSPLA
jgi:hypothetical protein